MRISAKVDYAVRAALELARSSPDRGSPPTKGDSIGEAQQIPTKYLENILSEMRRAGIVASRRGSDGGYWLARPADQVSVADIIRAVEGPLADVRGQAPEDLAYSGVARPLEAVWLATRASVRRVLETATLGAILDGELGSVIGDLLADPDVRERR
ncbi:MAG: RrF2 family transcriptional regulator [Microthrixaceae bacterium]